MAAGEKQRLWWHEQAAPDVSASNAWLSDREMRRLESFRFSGRRADWLLGRWTAKRAVAAYLHRPLNHANLAAIEIVAAPGGAPQVSAPASLSLSHRGGRAACAVGPPGIRLGCDLEIVEPHVPTFAADYFTAAEENSLAAAAPHDRDRLIALIWSAKESVLKALGIGLRADTRAVEIRVSLSAGAEWQPFHAECRGGQSFDGWWQQSGPLLRLVAGDPVCMEAHPGILLATQH